MQTQAFQKIKNELSGKTSFDAEHENDLFEKILQVEEMEKNGTGVPGLTRIDKVVAILLMLIMGIVPVIYYAVILL